MTIGKIIRTAALFPILALGFQGTAYAHKVVHIENTLYVIICEPSGAAYTFNGTAQGAGEIGNYICPPVPSNATGGGTGGAIEVIEARPAPRTVTTNGVVSPRDAASGLPTGKRQHQPVRVHKEMDKATPQLGK